MLTWIAAAAVAAAQPTAAPAHAEHQMAARHMAVAGGHKATDCCNHCKGMAGKHEGDSADHADHQSR